MNFDNQYLTYSEYRILEGKLQEMPFKILEYKAEKEIDKYTSSRFRNLNSNNYPQELKLCVNELINEYKTYNETGNKTSESIGNYSVNYNKPIIAEENKVLKSIIHNYLSETKVNDVFVLYCGADTYGN